MVNVRSKNKAHVSRWIYNTSPSIWDGACFVSFKINFNFVSIVSTFVPSTVNIENIACTKYYVEHWKMFTYYIKEVLSSMENLGLEKHPQNHPTYWQLLVNILVRLFEKNILE